MNKVYIRPDVYRKIMFFVNRSPVEVSGLGKLLCHSDGSFEVISAIVCRQVNTAASTQLEPEDMGKAMFELRDEPGLLNFWWHSHVNMDVFWSGTDRKCMSEFAAHGFVVATVFNKKKEMRSAYQDSQGRVPVFVDDMETIIGERNDGREELEWEKEYVAKCKPAPTVLNSYRGYGHGVDDDQTAWRALVNPQGTDNEPSIGGSYMDYQELDDLLESMLNENSLKNSKTWMKKIMQKIDKCKSFDAEEKVELRAYYRKEWKELKDYYDCKLPSSIEDLEMERANA